jgi:hypothetical protein
MEYCRYRSTCLRVLCVEGLDALGSGGSQMIKSDANAGIESGEN